MRSKVIRRAPLLTALCAAAFLSAACFGGQSGSQATATTTSASPAPFASPPAQASPQALGSPSASPPPSPAAGEQSYTVESGDTLAVIAQKFYGDPTQWRKIYDANKSAIGDDPDKLKVGTDIRIPPKD